MKKTGILLLTAAALLAAGCGGKKSDVTSFNAFSTSAEAGGGAYPAGAAQETAAAAYDYAMEAAAPPENMREEPQWEEQAPPEPTDSQNLTSPTAMDPPSTISRKLIRNVFMNVETDDFDSLITQFQSKVTQLGGYLEQSDISGSSITYNRVRPDRYASITARIPADKLDSFISVVEQNANVTNKSESTQDVTLQYSDLESRKKTLSMEQERIWALLEKADTLEAVIALEEHLSQIRYELESMETRLKLYDNQVAYSTIELSVHEVLPVDFTPVAPETVPQRIRKGFSKNVENVCEFFTDLLIAVVAGIPLWLPLLAALALFITIARRIFKKKAAPAFEGLGKPKNTEVPASAQESGGFDALQEAGSCKDDRSPDGD